MSGDELRPGIRRAFELPVRRPGEAAGDADAELAALIAERVDHLVASRGLTREAALAVALRGVDDGGGGRERVRQSAIHREHRMRMGEWLDDLAADLRFSLRSLVRSPALATAAVLTLALAIGANTAIFSAVQAVMLRPLPFADPGRLVMLWEQNPDFHWYQEDAAPANMLDWKEQAGVFTDVAGYPSFGSPVTLTGRGEPRLLPSQQVTGNFFSVLGVHPALGRGFTEAETWDDAPRVAILSHRAWRELFGADSGLIGRTVELAGRPVEVVGVLDRGFAFPGLEVDVWLPVRWNKANRSQTFFRRAHWVHAIGRLRPGVTLAGADAALQMVVARLSRDYPQTNTRMGAGMTPLHDFLVGTTRLPLLVMLGGVAVLLLIACANVANLLLVRAAGQEREAAVRLALGAGRGRLFRQAFAESAVLAGLGGLAGVTLGWWGTRVLAALQPAGMLPVRDFGMNGMVLGYALLATALAALVFGIAPTVWTVRRVPADVLRDQGRGSSGTVRARRWGEVLLVSQVALALSLTLGAGLLMRSYLLLQRVEPGFDTGQVLTATINLPGIRYDSTRKVLAFWAALEDGVRALPGVEATATVSTVPLGPPSWTSEFAIAGQAPLPAGSEVVHRELSPDYQKVMRVPLIRGRGLSRADREDAPNVVLINEAMARRYFAGRDPVGQRIAFDRNPDSASTWRTIVGVVGDERQRSLGQEPLPEVLAPHPQESRSGMTLVVRTTGDPAGMAGGVRQVVAGLDDKLAIASIRTMDEVRAESLARDRFLTVLMLSLAAVGMLLGLVGIYGVVAQLARRRTREMGIRLALGAHAAQVQWLVVRKGLGLTLVGIGGGVALALLATRVIRSLLFQVAPADPFTFLVVPLLVLVTAGLASWFPARRAGRSDPSQVLRAD